MATMIRPTLLLRMSLDAGSFSDDVVAEIKRSYSYVAPTLVESYATGEAVPENTVRFTVKIRNPYWISTDEGADGVWNDVMLKWLANMLDKTSSTMLAFNRIRSEKSEPSLDYSWFEVEFGEDALLALKLNADSSVPATALGSIAQVRACMNDGRFGEEAITRIYIPSHASVDAQVSKLRVGNGKTIESEAAEQKALLDVSDMSGVADGEANLNESHANEAAESEVSIEQLDVSLWGVEFADGTVRGYNSLTNTYVV